MFVQPSRIFLCAYRYVHKQEIYINAVTVTDGSMHNKSLL